MIVPRRPALLERFSSPARVTPLATAEGPGFGKTSIGLGASPLVPGERLVVSGGLPAAAVLFVRGIGEEGGFEGSFVLAAGLTSTERLEASVDGDGRPRLSVLRRGGRPLHDVDRGLLVRIL